MFDHKIAKCKGCGKDKQIVNKHFGLCHECNNNRLGPKKQNNLRPVSNKNSKQFTQLKATYDQIDKEREQECSGCGTTNHLSRSHIIPRSRRKDLEVDINNIRLYCMQRPDGTKGCHARWEGTLEEKKTLKDYLDNMIYIDIQDREYYNLILYKNG